MKTKKTNNYKCVAMWMCLSQCMCISPVECFNCFYVLKVLYGPSVAAMSDDEALLGEWFKILCYLQCIMQYFI